MVKPPSFKRPSISLGGNSRAWHNVAAVDVEIGDTVADLGIIISTSSSGYGVSLEGPTKSKHYYYEEEVFAFVKVPSV